MFHDFPLFAQFTIFITGRLIRLRILSARHSERNCHRSNLAKTGGNLRPCNGKFARRRNNEKKLTSIKHRMFVNRYYCVAQCDFWFSSKNHKYVQRARISHCVAGNPRRRRQLLDEQSPLHWMGWGSLRGAGKQKPGAMQTRPLSGTRFLHFGHAKTQKPPRRFFRYTCERGESVLPKSPKGRDRARYSTWRGRWRAAPGLTSPVIVAFSKIDHVEQLWPGLIRLVERFDECEKLRIANKARR